MVARSAWIKAERAATGPIHLADEAAQPGEMKGERPTQTHPPAFQG
jgi:hypothetical protein